MKGFAIHIDTFKEEIHRAFNVLGADKGFNQNVLDICEWRNNGLISDEDYKALRAYNRSVYAGLPLDM